MALATTTAAATGLVFSISPAKKQIKKDDVDDEQYMLILAPFNKSPKINFGHVKLNQIVEKNLLIVNPQEFDIILNVKNQDLNINNMNINIGPRCNVNFKLKWQPIKPESYKFTIIFEVLNSRLKFNVHAFGICDEPPKKPQVPRKPMTVLQPIRSFGMNAKQQQQKVIEATLKGNKENKVTTTTIQQQQQKKSFQIDSTYIIQEHNFTQTFQDHLSTTHIINDIRRQTVVIQSPKLQNDEFGLKTPTFKRLRRSISETNLARNNGQILEECETNGTPKLDDFMRRRAQKTPSPPHARLATLHQPAKNDKYNLDVTVSLVYKSPIVRVNPRLYDDSDSDDSMLDYYLDLNRIDTIINCQRMFRYKRFKRALCKLREEKQRVDRAVLTIQAWTRSMQVRYEYLRARRAIVQVQQKWRVKFERKRQAAVKIQQWTRSMSDRYRFLRFRRALIVIQRKWHVKYERRRVAAVKLQQWVKSLRERFDYLQKKRACVKIQQLWRVKYERRLQAAVKIQHWVRSMKERFKYLREKRALVRVQQKWRAKFERKREAAVKIQKWTRSMKERYEFLRTRRAIVSVQQKWRVKYGRKREAAVKIQQWTRAMSDRFYYIQLKRVTIQIQHKYKHKYAIRFMAALKIQQYYRMYKMRQLEHEQVQRFNAAATLIQAVWRGFRVRKEINIEQLFSIRQRLSVYIQRPEHNLTLGARIIRSLNTLKHSPSMTSIMTSLIDLKTVTRLSQECCIIFTQSGTINFLYEFIAKCNRSNPHMDLIKLSLDILINLAKCKNTCELIIDSGDKLNIMLHLLQSYQSTNPGIFMSVCILLIILASNKQCEFLRVQLLDEKFLRKITSMYQIFERRANLRAKNTRLPSGSSEHNLDTTITLNQTAASSVQIASAFTFEPEWSLSQKKIIEFIEPLSALQFLLCSTLNVNLNTGGLNQDLQTFILKTPKKFLDTASNARYTVDVHTGGKNVASSSSSVKASVQKESIKKSVVTSSSVKSTTISTTGKKAGLPVPTSVKKTEAARRKLI